MRRYYFDIRDERGLSADDEGVECSDIETVQHEAARALVDLARDAVHVDTCRLACRMSIEVRDDAGPIMKLTFAFEVIDAMTASGHTRKNSG